MTKWVEAIETFLEKGGSELGYSTDNVPNFEDWNVVLDYNVFIWEYNGKTKEEYYGLG